MLHRICSLPAQGSLFAVFCSEARGRLARVRGRPDAVTVQQCASCAQGLWVGFSAWPHSAVLRAGRLLAGVGCGAVSLYVPRYLTEIAPIAIRGGISTLNQARPGVRPAQRRGAARACAAPRRRPAGRAQLSSRPCSPLTDWTPGDTALLMAMRCSPAL